MDAIEKVDEKNEVSLSALSGEVQKVGTALSQLKKDFSENKYSPEKVKKFCSEELANLVAKQKDLREAAGMGVSEGNPRFSSAQEVLDVLPGSEGYTEDVRSFHQMNDNLVLLDCLRKADDRASRLQDIRSARAYGAIQKLADRSFGSEVKADMDTGTAAEGGDWVPTGFSNTLVEFIRLELQVAALHEDIPMPTDPFPLPLQTGGVTAVLGAENTAPTGTVVPTAKVQLDAVKIIAFVPFSYELEEDAVIAVAPIVQREIAVALAEGVEKALINGDITTATTGHIDADTATLADATLVEHAWDGYRRYTITTNLFTVDFANSFTESLVRSVRPKMVKYGVKPKNLAWIVGIDNYMKMLEFPTFQTIDKYGANATVLSGELGKLDGIPIIVSEHVRQDLSDDGTEGNGTGTDRSHILCIHRPSFVLGTRRGVMAESFRDVTKQQIQLVVSQRKGFVASRTGEKIAYNGINTNTG